MQGIEALRTAVTLAADVPCRPATARDVDLLDEAERWEALGRLVDARRVALAGEIAWRSREQIADASIARQHGNRNAAELIARELRIGVREAQRRTALGIRIRTRLSMHGEELPGRFPAIAAALQAGTIGVDAARVIVESLASVARRALPEEVDLAEQALVGEARLVSPDLLRVQASVWEARLDPDGAKPAEDAAHRKRGFRIGIEGEDGITRSVLLTGTEETALLRAIIDSHRRGVQWAQQPMEDCEDESEWHEAAGEQRNKPQFDHDTLMDVLRAGLRADADSASATAADPEVIVHVTASDLESGSGCGWADGVLGRISIPSVRRVQCAGSTRLLVTGGDGETLYLGRKARLFTRAQRRALAARDGGCAYPGCTAPLAWTQAHHIDWYERDDGTTDIDNGILLCSFHHHLIHSRPDWEIRTHRHVPYLVPRGWRGDPLPRHRMQQHRMHAAGAARSGAPPGRTA